MTALSNRFLSRRAVLCAILSALALPALAQTTSYPSKTIELVVPYPAGGSTDVVGRKLQMGLADVLGRTVIVDNKAGASGNIGAVHVARSPADGHRLLMATSAIVTVNPHVHPNAGFDPFKDLTPISLVSNGALAIAVVPSLGVNTLPELVQHAKRHPGQLFYATPSSGTPQHLMGELLNQVAGIDLTPVHYKGVTPAIQDVVGGRVQVIVSTYAALKPQLDAGRLKILAVAEARRIAAAPAVPAIAESYPGFEMTTWFGIFGPAGMPRDVVRKLEQSFAAVVAKADVRQLLDSLALPPVGGSAEQLARVLRVDYDKLGKVVRDKGITAD